MRTHRRPFWGAGNFAILCSCILQPSLPDPGEDDALRPIGPIRMDADLPCRPDVLCEKITMVVRLIQHAVQDVEGGYNRVVVEAAHGFYRSTISTPISTPLGTVTATGQQVGTQRRDAVR